MSSIDVDHQNYKVLAGLLAKPVKAKSEATRKIPHEKIASFYSEYVQFPDPREKNHVREYIEERFKYSDILMKKGDCLEAFFHLTNARAVFEKNCHYQPLKKFGQVFFSIPKKQYLWVNLLLGFAERERNRQLTDSGMLDYDSNYDDDAYLRLDSEGDANDVSTALLQHLCQLFLLLDMPDKVKKFYNEQMRLFRKQRATDAKKAVAHLMDALIFQCDRPMMQWPADLRTQFEGNWLEGMGYNRGRLLQIAKARRQHLVDYDWLVKNATRDEESSEEEELDSDSD